MGTAAPAGVSVCICVCYDVCVSDQRLSRCLCLGVCVPLLSFFANLNSLVATYQRNIEFGHTRVSTQHTANSVPSFPPSYHAFSPHPKLSCWWKAVLWHVCQCNSVSQKTLIACLESITHLKVIIEVLKVYLRPTFKVESQSTATQNYHLGSSSTSS